MRDKADELIGFFAGSQAIKALRESNVETILINPNVSLHSSLAKASINGDIDADRDHPDLPSPGV